MPAYIIVTRESPVTDQAAMDAYSQANRAASGIFREKYGIKPLAVYGALDTLEGQAPDGAIVLEFPSMADARAWYDSPEYQAALPDRLKGATWRAILVEGVPL